MRMRLAVALLSLMTLGSCTTTNKIDPKPIPTLTLSKRDSLWLRCIAGFSNDQVVACTEILGSNPSKKDHDLALCARGTAYLNKSEYDLAIADFNSYIESNGPNESVCTNRGNAYLHKQSNDLAIADYDCAIRINKKSGMAYLNRGVAHRQKGEFREAFADYDSALDIWKGTSSEALPLRNRAAANWRLGKLDLVLADYNRIIELSPNSAQDRYLRGYVYQRKGDLKSAEMDYAEAVKIQPDASRVYVRIGFLHNKLGRFDDALNDFNAALHVIPDWCIALYGRGLAKEGKGDIEGGKSDKASASKILPEIEKKALEWEEALDPTTPNMEALDP